MKKRRILSIFLIAALSTALVTGCGSKKVTEDITSGASTKSNTPASTATTKTNPVVTMEMSDGSKIKIELYPNIAPNTVNNFISLVQKGFYDGLTFHRIVPGFMIQGGDPKGDGTGGPGYGIKGEFKSNGFSNTLLHTKGVISMARATDPNSGGSQFFIMLGDTPQLDGDYAAFGKVTEGLDVVDKIATTKTIAGSYNGENSEPVVKPIMKKVTVDTFGETYKAPDKN